MGVLRFLAWPGVLVAIVLAQAGPLRAACVGDCDGDGTVAINELVTLVDIGLDGIGVDALRRR